MTCLVPTENREVAGPMRLNLPAILGEFLDFREDVVTRRFEFELAELHRRIHILQGFAILFDALDEAIRIIRKSEGKADAAEQAAGALQARRGAGRRDPGDEAVQAGAAGDPGDSR